ncbi:DUF4123 domain-containing protein [Cupriavidus pauculus]|uniref:DUF4123 domain-containing protein n=1 Tax=Cupriavidus pauculus TaxID=82633 RepID=A0A3G8H7X2_9BURK|nr:DUF4123 domain-containing protein [Cupriavidus pauculus]AZG15652.1 DUF4123 domain-containing protein [Cupriavidus pauculus]
MSMKLSDDRPLTAPSDQDTGSLAAQVLAARHRLDRHDAGTAVSLFALVDTREFPELRAAIERHGGIAFAALWDGTDLAPHRDISPLLITVVDGAKGIKSYEDKDDGDGDDGSLPLLNRLAELPADGFMVTWLWSFCSLPEVAAHLRGYCEYALPDRRAFYLHFYDNRVLERLRKVWTPEQWSAFASIACEIWYRDRSGAPVVDAQHPVPVESLTASAPVMTAEQHAALLELGYADKIALQLRDVYGTHLDPLSPDALYGAVQTQMERAAAYGITSEADMLRYVAKGLLVSPEFDQHPEIHRRLLSAKYGDLPFAVVLSDVGTAETPDTTDMER